MAMAIQRFAAMTGDERRHLGESGYEYVKKNHDTQTLADRLESIFQN